MFALQAGGQIMQHQAAGAGVKARNRARLRNFEEQNRQYNREVMLDNNEWKNEVQVQDIEQDQVYQAMISQWAEQDKQLDKIFAQGDQKIEKAIREMYENDYAGTQTGKTAARLAGEGARKLGQYKSEVLHNMMMAKDEAALKSEIIHQDAQSKSWGLYEKIRFSPIHGHTPIAPELEAKPGMGGLILGLASSALGAAKAGGAFTAPSIGKGLPLSGAEPSALGLDGTSNIGGMSIARGGFAGQFDADAGLSGVGSDWSSAASPGIGWSSQVSSGPDANFYQFAGSTTTNPFN